jgi:DNA-binding CsgD family transcriptional regulator
MEHSIRSEFGIVDAREPLARRQPYAPSGRVSSLHFPGGTSRSAIATDGRASTGFAGGDALDGRPGHHRSASARHSSRDGAHILLPLAIFGGIAALLAADLLSDYNAGHGPVHFALEVAAGVLALVGVSFYLRHAWVIHGVADDLERDLRVSEAKAGQWRAEAQQALDGLGAAIDCEFGKWNLTEAERSVALLLLKGLSHKEIATRRGTNEGTVRQQALATYRKAGLSGRSSLSAFFLEGLVLPDRSAYPED